MRSSMAHNVGQGFLNDAKGCDLNGGRERRQMFWRGQGYTHIATLLSRDSMFTNSRDQAKFIEHRWTQGIDQAADIGNGRANLPFERLQQCYCFLGLLSHQVAGGIDTLGQAGQGGTKSIMEIAAQGAAGQSDCATGGSRRGSTQGECRPGRRVFSIDGGTTSMKDISTMILKETKELFSQGGLTGYLTSLVFLAVGGVVYPLISWSSWMQLGSLAIPLILFLTFQQVVSSAADSFVGERERHTLETLLASRMPDRAIVLGKIGALVGYGLGINFSLLLLGWLAITIVHWQERLVFYPLDLLLLTLGLGLVVIILAASAGVLVSLRSATARQALQMLAVGGLVVTFGVTFGLLELTGNLLPSLGIVLSLTQLLALLLGLLTGIDIIVLTLALVRFQRSRLMLIGK